MLNKRTIRQAQIKMHLLVLLCLHIKKYLLPIMLIVVLINAKTFYFELSYCLVLIKKLFDHIIDKHPMLYYSAIVLINLFVASSSYLRFKRL